MPRGSKASKPSFPSQTLIIDNGAYNIKAGFATENPDSSQCRITPNCIARARDRRVWIGSQLEGCKDFGEMAYRRPVEKGYVVNWEGEKAIWEHEFFADDAKLKCDPSDTNLILTEAPNSPAALQANCDQMIFEEFEFATYLRVLGPSLNAYNNIPALFSDSVSPSQFPPTEHLLLIDSGYSHTTITPLYKGRPFHSAIRRLSVGGKFLTNYLKELISLRHLNFMDETHLVNEIKEDICYVSSQFSVDLDRTWTRANKPVDTSVVVDYVLPDYSDRQRGYARPHDPSAAAKAKRLGVSGGPKEDILPLGNERFSVPELLFSPLDIGLQEPGLPEATLQSLQQLPEGLRPAMLANVVVVGGNTLIPGFIERLEAELRSIMPAEWPLRVKRPDDPITYTWLGGAKLAQNTDLLKSLVVTREDYLENGSNWLARKFLTG
ncbi:actin family [Phyllosticta capitalensis]|uniref:Actin family n=1 Tax=Phyllosticta capitalensis TaxID=121624 RepID=A0ABR1Z3D8_9PEZI